MNSPWSSSVGYILLIGLSVCFTIAYMSLTTTPTVSSLPPTSSFLHSLLKNIPTNGGKPHRTVMAGPNHTVLMWDSEFHVYRIDNKPIIWMFWDKATMPAMIGLGIASVECHNPNFHVQRVSLEDIPFWIDHIHPAFQYLIPAHKADYFRARVLSSYGGIYLDTDSVGLASFWHLFQNLYSFDIVNISWPPDGDLISITSMGPMRAQSKFTSKWVANLHILLDQKLGKFEAMKSNPNEKYPLQWAEMLRDITKPLIVKLVEDVDFSLFSLTGHKSFGQLVVSGKGPETKLDEKTSFSWTETELLMFHNSAIGGEICQFSLQDFLKSPILLAELFRHTFRQCYQKYSNGDNLSVPQMSTDTKFEVGGSHSLLQLNSQELQWISNYLKKRKYNVRGI